MLDKIEANHNCLKWIFNDVNFTRRVNVQHAANKPCKVPSVSCFGVLFNMLPGAPG